MEPDATEREIRKQFKRLSLKKHPDKNPDDPLAAQDFIRLTKAYKVLTDDVSRENFRKYGNPDGPGSYSVAIAMPKFVLKKENRLPVLIGAFSFLLIALPVFVYFNFADSTVQNEHGLHLDNRKIFGTLMRTNMNQLDVANILTRTLEIAKMKANNKKELEVLKKIKQNTYVASMIENLSKSKSFSKGNMKPLLMLLGHMYRVPEVRDPALA